MVEFGLGWLSTVDASKAQHTTAKAKSKGKFHHADVSDPITAIEIENNLAMKWNVWILELEH